MGASGGSVVIANIGYYPILGLFLAGLSSKADLSS
jgi:hypothetical protein